MSGKFMSIKRFTIPTITLAIIASQLMGCAAVSQSELLTMINNAESIEIEIATPINQEQGTEQTLDWIQLDQLKTNPELRALIDDLFKVIEANGTKNGPMYVDLEGNQNGNNTLYNAFMNSKFRDYYNDSLIRTEISNEVLNTYADIDFDGNDTTIPMYAALNAYFNLIADADPGYSNPDSTLTRAEAMAALFKAENPVTDKLAVDNEFNTAVDSSNKNPNTIYASNMSEVSYLDIESSSLDNMTFNGTITRGEFIYMLVQQYFQDDYNKVDPKTADNYSDIKNGGDIATQQKFIEDGTQKKYWQSYELTYALQNPDKGAPERLYKALAVAYQKDLINDTESRWDEGLTKSDFFEMLTNTYQALPTITNTERGLTKELEVQEADPNAVITEAATLEGEYDERIHGEFAEPEVKEEQATEAEEQAYQDLKDAGIDLSQYTEQELAIILDILKKQEPVNPNKHIEVAPVDYGTYGTTESTDPGRFGSTDASQFAGMGNME